MNPDAKSDDELERISVRGEKMASLHNSLNLYNFVQKPRCHLLMKVTHCKQPEHSCQFPNLSNLFRVISYGQKHTFKRQMGDADVSLRVVGSL